MRRESASIKQVWPLCRDQAFRDFVPYSLYSAALIQLVDFSRWLVFGKSPRKLKVWKVMKCTPSSPGIQSDCCPRTYHLLPYIMTAVPIRIKGKARASIARHTIDRK